jgi:potassium/hydrogen antiporter
LLLIVGAVLAASIVVALVAARTGLPVLVASLGLGMVIGSDGPGGIEFDAAVLARRVGIVALILILCEGGSKHRGDACAKLRFLRRCSARSAWSSARS